MSTFIACYHCNIVQQHLPLLLLWFCGNLAHDTKKKLKANPKMHKANEIEIEQAQTFLADYFDPAPTEIEFIGAGAWSQCYGFRHAERDLVIRFGKYVDDFQKDQVAYRYATPELPIPQVLDLGQVYDRYYAISTRAHGIPLESVGARQWESLVPALADALEAMRTADLSHTSGLGGWGVNGNAPFAEWSSHLLAVADDTPDRRTYGWRNKLATHRQGEDAFVWGYDLLKTLADSPVPRCLLHCDLINRNVLVNGDRITGIFDWGCSLYGDHLYELAWFEFWASWYPDLKIQLLRSELERCWQAVDYTPADKEARLTAYYLHIGLDHLAYNAYLEDWPAVLATAERMQMLVNSTNRETQA